ncbi:MAG: alpha/beta hydrolase [Geodermatophilaceae bacterium]
MKHSIYKRLATAWVILVAVAACGASAGSPDPSASSNGTGDPADVLVSVDGRSIAGTCAGESAPGAPTVVLSSGLGNSTTQLASIRSALEPETRVCSYDRAGLGPSDPSPTTQSLSDVVDDLHAFLDQGEITPPYVLVGHSFGGSIVIRYAQQHPDDVVGFVTMNPVPPYTSWIQRASAVETPEELQTMEIDFYSGANDEGLDLRDTDLTIGEPISDDIPYVVMYAEDCPGDFCDRIRPVLEAATSEFADLGAQGTFVAVPNAGHEIFLTNLDDVLAEIRSLLE